MQSTLPLRTPCFDKHSDYKDSSLIPRKNNLQTFDKENSRYYGLLLLRTLTKGPYSVRYKGSWRNEVSVKRDCTWNQESRNPILYCISLEGATNLSLLACVQPAASSLVLFDGLGWLYTGYSLLTILTTPHNRVDLLTGWLRLPRRLASILRHRGQRSCVSHNFRTFQT